MSSKDHRLDRIHADDFIHHAIMESEVDALRRAVIGGWQCQRCFLASMDTWREEPNPDDAPACCGGESMLPYRITPMTRDEADRNVKIVSRWIEDIERAESSPRNAAETDAQ